MRVELLIIDEPDAGLCVGADFTGNGKISKLLISTFCRNNYVSEELYARFEHETPPTPVQVPVDTAYYLNYDLSKTRGGIIKALQLPGDRLLDVPVIVTPSFPAYQCDMILGYQILGGHWFQADPASGLVVISDERQKEGS